MSAVTRRYFWCDAPSPLHDVLKAEIARRAEFQQAGLQLAESVGARDFARGAYSVTGLIFGDGGPPEGGGIHWKKVGHVREGDAFYMPKRNTKAGRALFGRMKKLRPINVSDAVSRASGLYVMTFGGGYMHHTTAGNCDGRIFLCIPQGGDGDEFPTIPGFLTECPKWEMERWFDVGRAGVEGGAS